MRKIITTTFVTLDGVMQAPGGSKEDTAEGFQYGGWQMDWGEDGEADQLMATHVMAEQSDILLGRITYDIWTGYWPKHKDEPNFGKSFDIATKYVVSHKPFEMKWDNSKLITGDVPAEIQKLKNTDGPDLVVWGSANLIQTLLKYNLIDRMHIWTFPVTIGTGKKLFADGTQPQRFKSVFGKVTKTGVVLSTYEPSEPLKKSS